MNVIGCNTSVGCFSHGCRTGHFEKQFEMNVYFRIKVESHDKVKLTLNQKKKKANKAFEYKTGKRVWKKNCTCLPSATLSTNNKQLLSLKYRQHEHNPPTRITITRKHQKSEARNQKIFFPIVLRYICIDNIVYHHIWFIWILPLFDFRKIRFPYSEPTSIRTENELTFMKFLMIGGLSKKCQTKIRERARRARYWRQRCAWWPMYTTGRAKAASTQHIRLVWQVLVVSQAHNLLDCLLMIPIQAAPS